MSTLPFELSVLAALTFLAASLWIPYIVGINTAPAGSIPDDAPDGFRLPGQFRVHRPWVQRAFRAHLNLLEQFLPFAVLVLLVDRADGFSSLTAWTAAAFLVVRLVHAAGYITGWIGFPWRPIIFTLGWICCLMMFGALVMA